MAFDKIYLDPDMPPRAILVYLYLASRMDKSHVCWPGIARIGADLSLSRSTVKRALKDLQNGKYVGIEEACRENGSKTSNRYHIL